MLVLGRKVGESIIIGDNIELTITEISGDRVKIGIEAPAEVTIYRKELKLTIDSNKQAVMGVPGARLGELLTALKQKK